jgi:hypothetical protein
VSELRGIPLWYAIESQHGREYSTEPEVRDDPPVLIAFPIDEQIGVRVWRDKWRGFSPTRWWGSTEPYLAIPLDAASEVDAAADPVVYDHYEVHYTHLMKERDKAQAQTLCQEDEIRDLRDELSAAVNTSIRHSRDSDEMRAELHRCHVEISDLHAERRALEVDHAQGYAQALRERNHALRVVDAARAFHVVRDKRTQDALGAALRQFDAFAESRTTQVWPLTPENSDLIERIARTELTEEGPT